MGASTKLDFVAGVLQWYPFVIASHDLPFAQKMTSLSLQSLRFDSKCLLNLIVSWIKPKELARTVHTVRFRCTHRR